MTDPFRPLAPGIPLAYWRVSPIAEERYDLPDTPMSGAMDSAFFLTRDRNFIPHEYPCRTAFASAHRDRRPDVRGTPAFTRNWLPFGAPSLDLSGFWFRPTRIAAWAETVILAQVPGPARLRLATCGGAVLFANGAECGHLAPYTRNKEADTELALTLAAGETRLRVFFDDLAERDTRFGFQLDWLDGPPARQGNPFDAPPDLVAEIESALDIRALRGSGLHDRRSRPPPPPDPPGPRHHRDRRREHPPPPPHPDPRARRRPPLPRSGGIPSARLPPLHRHRRLRRLRRLPHPRPGDRPPRHPAASRPRRRGARHRRRPGRARPDDRPRPPRHRPARPRNRGDDRRLPPAHRRLLGLRRLLPRPPPLDPRPLRPRPLPRPRRRDRPHHPRLPLLARRARQRRPVVLLREPRPPDAHLRLPRRPPPPAGPLHPLQPHRRRPIRHRRAPASAPGSTTSSAGRWPSSTPPPTSPSTSRA